MEINHLKEETKFVALVDGAQAHLLYRETSGVLDFYSTYVPESLRGKSIARHLVDAGVKYATENKFKVKPSCSYVDVYFKRRPELNDLKV